MDCVDTANGSLRTGGLGLSENSNKGQSKSMKINNLLKIKKNVLIIL